MRVELKGGFYQARSVIANAVRCVNLYPEKNPQETQDSPATYTLYQTPGLIERGVPPAPGAGRGIYQASNGNLYAVAGQKVYSVNSNYLFTQIGALVAPRSTPVSMFDNRTDLVIVDGSPQGYTVNLSTNAFGQIIDPAFYGADKVDYIDTFLLFNKPGTNIFYSTLSNIVTPFDPTYFAAKTGYPDNLSTLIAVHKELLLIGSQLTTEVFFDSGGSSFPFAQVAGVFMEHGCMAKYSVAKHDLYAFWLGIDRGGVGTVTMYAGYQVKRISTFALEHEFSKYKTLADAIGMIYKQQDHIFYILSFPSADRTWVFDVSEGLWHERVSLDSDGNEHRIRPSCMTVAYNKNLALDWQTGTLYEISPDEYTDNGSPIVRRRGYPHLVNDGKRVSYNDFRCDVSTGGGGPIVRTPWSDGWSDGWGPVERLDPSNIYLRWSDTRGRSFGNAVGQPLGAEGQFILQPQWRDLGLARDRIFEVFWTSPFEYALQGAWVDATPAET